MTPEEALTINCVDTFNMIWKDRIVIHIANERKTRTIKTKSGKHVSIEGMKLKRMGVRKGVADLLIPEPTDLYHGLWIELKSTTMCKKTYRPIRGNYPDHEQRAFLAQMQKRGYATAVAWTTGEFIGYCTAYFNHQPVQCEYLDKVLS